MTKWCLRDAIERAMKEGTPEHLLRALKDDGYVVVQECDAEAITRMYELTTLVGNISFYPVLAVREPEKYFKG